MKPYDDDVVNVAMQVQGLRGAVERLVRAAAEPGEASDTYLPLFEALNWAVSLDQRVQHLLRPEGQDEKLGRAWRQRVRGGERLAAIDWARNVVHHQWANALRLDPAGHGLHPSNETHPSDGLYPQADHAWIWRDAEDLPPRRERRRASADETAGPTGREAYVTFLEAQPAPDTMVELLATFELVGQMLEPPSPPGAGRTPKLH